MENTEQVVKQRDQLQDELNVLKIKYKKLADKVMEMMDTQQAYFKSDKDFHLLRRSKGLEAEVREMIRPKQSVQASLDWLGQ